MVQRALKFVQAALRGDIRLVRFLLVGGLNTLFGYGVFALMLWFGFHYSAASAIATVMGILFNFKSTGRLVFKSSDNSRLVRFILVYIVVYGVNVASLALLLRADIGAYTAGLLLILPLALLAYFLNASFVFRSDEKTP
ncbi:GtrA family protein [Devosia riboflavina]